MSDQQVVNASSSNESASRPSIDIESYLRVLLKRKWMILSVWVLVLGAATVWVFTRTKIYRAKATVLVLDRAPEVLGAEVQEVVDTSTGSYFRNKEYMETQQRVIKSKSLSRRVAERLQLSSNRDFWAPKAAPSGPSAVEQTAERLRHLINANVLKGTNILEVSVEHASPKMAARLANAVVHAYLDQNIEYKVSSSTGASQWLADQLDSLRGQLQDAEMALYNFKKSNNIVSISLEDKQSLVNLRITKLSETLTQLRMDRIALESQRQLVDKALKMDPFEVTVPAVLENAEVNALKAAVTELERKVATLRVKYLEQHPVVVQQETELARVRGDLARAVRTVLDGIRTRYNTLRDTETRMAAELQQAKDEALALNKREVSYQRLVRNQENTAKLYSLVLGRMKESDLTGQLRVSNMRLLDAADAPKGPISPRVAVSLMLGGLFGLLLGVGLAFLVETMDTSVKTQEDIDRIPGLIYLGLLPRIANTGASGRSRAAPDSGYELYVHRTPQSPVAEACRAVRTNLLFTSPDTPMRTLLVTSPGPREGKTTTAISIAITMAQAGGRVLVVDTDMRRPRIHKVFGVTGSHGITNVLLGDSTVDSEIKTTEVPNLFVLPCGPTPPNPAELCQSERFRELLHQLGGRFDRVVLDSPPLMPVTDATLLSTLVDGTLLVARSGLTSTTALRIGSSQIASVGGRLLGCVVNDFDMERRGYGYYSYRYGYGTYRYGYAENEDSASS